MTCSQCIAAITQRPWAWILLKFRYIYIFFLGGGVNLLLLNLKLPLGRSYLYLNLYFRRSHHLCESYEWLTKFVNHNLFSQEYNNITDQTGWHKVLLPIIKTTCITKLIIKIIIIINNYCYMLGFKTQEIQRVFC